MDSRINRGRVITSSFLPLSSSSSSSVDIPCNRYYGIPYSLRFYLTKVSFLRTMYRLFCFSREHLFIFDGNGNDLLKKYELKSLEIGMEKEKGKINVNGKDIYGIKDREVFISAFYTLKQLQYGTHGVGLGGGSGPYCVLKLSRSQRYADIV